MTSALKEIVDRYEALVLEFPGTDIERCKELISRARAELERGVDVRALLQHHYRLMEERGKSTPSDNRRDMTEALRAQGVRVVEGGKEST